MDIVVAEDLGESHPITLDQLVNPLDDILRIEQGFHGVAESSAASLLALRFL